MAGGNGGGGGGAKTGAVAPATGWVFGPWRDLLIGCGGWSVPLMGVTFILGRESVVVVAFLFYTLAIFCNNPHYMATIYRAYGTRADFSKYRFFTVYLTALLAGTALVLHWRPALLPLVFTTYLVWSPWHYTGQNFGLALMMARRRGVAVSRADRNLLQLAFVISYLFWLVSLNATLPDDAKVITLGLPPALAWPLQGALAVFFIFVAGWVSARLVRRWGWAPLAAPLVLLSSQFLWFVLPAAAALLPGAGMAAPATYYSAGVLAFMHCAQYLWVTSYYARREAEAGLRGGRRWNPRAYYLALVVGGIALFIPGPWLISRIFGHDLYESLFIFMALVNIHHFVLDGAIWKLRDGRIARLLLGSVRGGEGDPGAGGDGGRGDPRAGAVAWGWLVGSSRGARAVRWATATSVLAGGALDQLQYYLTLPPGDLAALATAERLNPNDSRVYFRRAKLHLEQGRGDLALAQLEKAADLGPNNLPVQMARGEVLAGSGRTEEAYRHFEAMAGSFRPMGPVLVNAGLSARRTGRLDRAVAWFAEALSIDPADARLHLYLAESLREAGDPDRAVEHFERYLGAVASGALVPESPRQFLLVELKLAYTHLDAGRPGEALRWFRAAARDAHAAGDLPAALEAIESAAETLEAQGEVERAVEFRRFARELSAPGG